MVNLVKSKIAEIDRREGIVHEVKQKRYKRKKFVTQKEKNDAKRRNRDAATLRAKRIRSMNRLLRLEENER